MCFKIHFLIFIILQSFQSSNNAAVDKNIFSNTNSEVVGLYSTKEDVQILTVHNFKEKVINSKKGWLVEFYNSYCGFCQRFAPSWKSFATDVKEWKDLVSVAALDCSNEENYALCRDFEIMSYPTLRYYHENFEEKEKNFGKVITAGKTAKDHRETLIKLIMDEQNMTRGAHYPNLSPYNEEPTLIYNNLPATTKFVFLIVQEPDTFIGQEIILDLHALKDVVINYAYNNITKIQTRLNVTSVPAVYVFDEYKVPHILSSGSQREMIKNSILEFLKGKNIFLSQKNQENNENTGVDQKLKAINKGKITDKDVVFQVDLENALKFSLKREVSRVKEITGEKLESLRSYVKILEKYFPFGLNGQSFLEELYKNINIKTVVNGKDINKMLKDAEKNESKIFSSKDHWIGCQGSNPTLRGYPCGLWKLFHYLTVASADNPKDTFDNEVLNAMHGYIRNFFGCADCSEHFQEMAKKRVLSEVSNADNAIIWLWQAHNEVNRRLAGDETEDPSYPKVQFPTRNRCPECYNHNEWVNEEVLKYLKSVYGSFNVDHTDSDEQILAREASPSGSSPFNTIDTSMCLILYLACFCLLIILIRFFLKNRGYRKKPYVHDLLGKV